MTPPKSEAELENLVQSVSEMKGQALASALERLTAIFSRDHQNHWLLSEAAQRLKRSKARRG